MGCYLQIHPPDEDVAGNPVNCEPPQCSLHFHMDTSAYARLGVFSTESAPGIIIAHGTLIYITHITGIILPNIYSFFRYARGDIV